MNLLPTTPQTSNLRKYLVMVLLLILVVSMLNYYFNYKSNLKEQLTSLKLSEQPVKNSSTLWSDLLGEIPLNQEKINISTITKKANGLLVAGEALNFLAVAELAIMINNSKLIDAVRIDNIEKIEDNIVHFKISILLQ